MALVWPISIRNKKGGDGYETMVFECIIVVDYIFQKAIVFLHDVWYHLFTTYYRTKVRYQIAF